MQFCSMLIHDYCCLGTAIAICVVEIQCGNGILAVNTFERDTAVVHLFSSVIAHSFIVVLRQVPILGQ